MSSISNLRISGSALTAERVRLEAITENIANAQTTRAANGQPYRRRQVVFEAQPAATNGGGVRAAQVVESSAPFERIYDPGHPDADAQGYVQMPNVNVVEEMVDLVAASRAYEANTVAANSTKSMVSHALDLGK